MKRLLPFLLLFLISSPAFAGTYYASPSGSGAASCVDNGANVCTIQRAIDVLPAGTHTIIATAGTYPFTSVKTFDVGELGKNITIQCASALGCTATTTDATNMFLIGADMHSGSVTLDGWNFTDDNVDYTIEDDAPKVSLSVINSTCSNQDPTQGVCVRVTSNASYRIEQIVGNDSTIGIKTGATTNTKVAQKITIGGSNLTADMVNIYIKATGTFDLQNLETLTATIETDSAGAPSGTPVTNGTSNAVYVNTIKSGESTWTGFKFANEMTLTASTVYWIVITPSYSASASNYISWEIDTTSGGYASGDAATYNGTTWTTLASQDFLFSFGVERTRDITVTGNTFSPRLAPISIGGADEISIQNNSLTMTDTSTTSGVINVTNNFQNSIYAAESVLIKNNTIVHTAYTGGFAIAGQTSGSLYINKMVLDSNTITTGRLIQVDNFLRRLFVYNNTMTLAYSGNVPIRVGYEVDGTGAESWTYNGFESQIWEKNTITYTGSTNNHMMLIGMGAANGVLRNNTIINSVTSTGASWGIILKADNWKVTNNKFFGACPALYLSGTNNSYVTNNTMECVTTGTDGALYISTHQDNIYGRNNGKHGVPFDNFVEDNIFITRSAGSFGIEQTSGMTLTTGLRRVPEFWNNRIDYNIYYNKGSATSQAQISNNGTSDTITTAEGISSLQSDWQSSTYTNKSSISDYNDLNSYFANPLIGDTQSGVFTATSPAKNNASITNTSIGAIQSSGGRKWIGRTGK